MPRGTELKRIDDCDIVTPNVSNANVSNANVNKGLADITSPM